MIKVSFKGRLVRRLRWSIVWRALALMALAVFLFYLYGRYMAPTRIALVNYPGFQAAKFAQADDVGWVTVERFEGADYRELAQFDLVLVFGRGLALDDQALQDLKAVAEARPVYVDAPMNPSHGINTLPISHRTVVIDYLDNAGEQNYQNLLRYVRADMQGRLVGVKEAEPLREIASNVLFHLGPTAIFEDIESYEDYYATTDSYSPEGPKVALLTTVPGPFNANRDHTDALIQHLEAAGYRVYPLASISRRLDMLKQIEPDIVVLMPHGRLHTGDAREAVAWLKQQNVPLLAPLSVFEQYDAWLNNPQGYQGALLSMNVVLPELDGAIAPYVINAQFDTATEAGIFKAIPERLEGFLTLLNGFTQLKVVDNADKKIAIVYFRGPGKNALTAGNMEVARSLYNTLQDLRERGYDVSGLPANFEAFQADLDRQGLVMSPRAPGQIEDFMATADPALLPAQQYRQWCQALAADLCQQVEALYGPAPGNYLVAEEGIAVARLQYGNVALLPQPLPGFGSNTFAMVHGTDKAPPHTYLAAYFWLRHVFEADALMHFGTHGSLEFTPSKQVALSDTDWADALTAGIPHFYVYTMSNVGEAIIAKRRSYATIINHLTPPFSRAGLDSDLDRLRRELTTYAGTEGAVKEQSRQSIVRAVRELDIERDLQLTDSMLDNPQGWDRQVRLPLAQWLESVADEKITQGLYVLGSPYSAEQASQTAQLMFVDTLAAHIAQIDALLPGKNHTSSPADDWIAQAHNGGSARDVLLQRYPQLYSQVQAWREGNPVVSDMDIVRGFIALKEGATDQQDEAATALGVEALQERLVQVLADPEAREFLLSLEDDRSFSHVSKTLSPAARQRAQALARVIPAIGRALEQLAKPDVEVLVTQMQNPDTRQQVLEWLNSGDFTAQVALAREQRERVLADSAAQDIDSLQLELTREAFQRLRWTEQQAVINANRHFAEQYLSGDGAVSAVAQVIEAKRGTTTAELERQLAAATTRYEAVYRVTTERFETLSRHLADIESLLEAVPASVAYLQEGDTYEFAALANALSGGYVEPASGGDPVLNPLALPTGRNMYSIDAEKTPSEAAWRVGVAMAEELLESHRQSTGAIPRKVAFTLWPSSFIHSQGATVAEILYLLGVEPVRDPFGRIQTLRLIPEAELGRPRIDVVAQSAGQLRDLAASRLALIEEAVAMAAAADDAGVNYVREGTRAAEKYLLDQGQSPLAARSLSQRRSFGGVNNSYGTGIMGLVEESERWDSREQIAAQYLQNMGAVYGDSDTWGEFNQALFAAALLNTEVIVQPRSSNTWGALSLDHVYEFMGGLSAAVTDVTGNSPAAYFNDFRNSGQAKLSTLEQTIWLEARTSLLNPAYISALTATGGASSAEVFAETFRNTFGWSSMREGAIDNALWDQLHEVYARERHGLQLQAFFREQNPYALQEMTGVMLEASRKGFWDASETQLRELAALHARLVDDFEAGCGSFTCGNTPLQQFIEDLLDEGQRAAYSSALNAAQTSEQAADSIVLVEQQPQTERSAEERDAVANTAPETATAQSRTDTASAPATRLLLLFFVALLLALGAWLIGYRRARR